MAREVLDMERKLFGPEHRRGASALNAVARAAAADGKQKEAEDLEREALAMRQKLLSQEHPDVANSLYLVGDRMRQRGNLKEAYPVLSAALSIQRKVLGENNPNTLYALKSLGLMYKAEYKWSEAETVFRQVLAAWRRRAGNDDLETLYALRNLGEALEGQGKRSEAEALHREALASWRKRAGNEDQQTLYTLDRLGWTLEGEGKWSEAESVYREALALRRKRAAIDDPQVLSECEQLCRGLREQRKYHDMEQLLAEVLTPEFLKLPACCTLVARRLDVIGRQGRWSEALDVTATLMQHQPAEYYWAYAMAALLAKAHDRPAYAQLCKKIPATFIETTNPYIAWRVAIGCLLLPNSGADRRLVQQLATKAGTLGKADNGIGYFKACKALSEYREGGFAQAIEWAGQVRTNSEASASAEACSVLAMAQWRLGLKDEARDTLTQGNRLAPEMPSTQGPDLGDKWLDWLIARILLVEGTERISAQC